MIWKSEGEKTSVEIVRMDLVKEKLAQDDELRDEIRSISLNNEFVSDSLMVEGPSDFEGVGNETSKVAEAIDTLFNLLISLEFECA